MSGFIGGACPITNELSPNVTMNFERFHLSYNNRSGDYGCDTTAIVLDGRVFMLLNGEHKNALSNAAQENGIHGCVDYFIANIDKANRFSEHLTLIGIGNDQFALIPTAIEVIGEINIGRIAEACKAPEMV